MNSAIYPGSFDPMTNGHLDIATRSSRLFENLIIAVYKTPPKGALFSTAERVKMVEEATSHLPNIVVEAFSGLVVEAARQRGTMFIVRGLRAGSDFEYEFEMFLMNQKLAPDIEVVALMSALEYQFVSSSRIKEVAQLGGDVTSLVPPGVARMLAERIQMSF